MTTKLILIGIVVFTNYRATYAQQAVITSGGDASGNGGTIAFTVGQIVYWANTEPNGSIIQGVQQPYEIFSVGISESALSISLDVFPNPTSNNLHLNVQDFTNSDLAYQLLNMQGNLLEQEEIARGQTQINMSGLPAATYLLNVIQENQIIQSFKIIKNN